MTADIVLAPDKFKGSLTARQAVRAMTFGVHRADPTLAVLGCPVADGGEGTLDAALAAGFDYVPVQACGPTGVALRTGYGRRGSTALVELAEVCGLARLPSSTPVPMTASSHGLGVVVAHALDQGCRDIILAVGGSASTDGGAGMLGALGATVLDATGDPIAPGGQGISTATTVDLTRLHPAVAEATFTVAADVDNPLCGPRGAAAVYAPQKGADPQQVRLLDHALGTWARLVAATTLVDYSEVPGAGAAGGVGFAALAVLGARMRSGIDMILDLVDLDQKLSGAKLVLTGEGSLDAQSLRGKAPLGVCRRARGQHIPTVAIAGVSTLRPDEAAGADFAGIHTLAELEPDRARCIANAADLLTVCTEKAVRQAFDRRPG